MEVRYLNVDCILKSTDSLAPLLSYLNDEVFVLWNDLSAGVFSVGLETNLIDTKGPEEDIHQFLKLFESLPSHLASVIADCEEKVFDIGFESGDQGVPLEVFLNLTLLERVSRLGFGIGLRIYTTEIKGSAES